jgi:hypothetical protein
LDRRSDVYSLGAVFYEMVAGEPPVSGATAQAIIAKLLTEKPVRLRVIRETVPVGMDRATEKALAKVPADRFDSAGELARALAASTLESDRPAPTPRRPWSRVAVGAFALVALAAAGFWLSRDRARVGSAPVSLRDRAQITNTGRVSWPTISGDGKTIAYVVTDCGAGGCRYGVEIQDVAGGQGRRVLEGATALYSIEMSPDRRNLIVLGSINRSYGSFIISTLGGAPRLLVTGAAAFYAGGDSLLLWRGTPPAKTLWIMVSGLDGVPADSIRVDGPAERIKVITSVPNSRRIMYELAKGPAMEWVSSDRTGARYSSTSLLRGFVMSESGTTSSDALWIQTMSPGAIQRASIVRIPFDSSTGRLAPSGDTVYTGTQTSFGVTADGGTLVLDEGITEFGVWALSVDDLLKGKFSDDKRIFRATTAPRVGLSRDASVILIGKNAAGISDLRQWSIAPFAGGQEISIPGRHRRAWIVDSATIAIEDGTTSGLQFSLYDYQNRRSSAVLSISDSSVDDFTRLRGPQAWAWTSGDRLAINIQRDGDSRIRRIPIPSAYARVFNLTASEDGSSIAFVGWNAPAEDSLGIGILSVPDGRYTQLIMTFAEGAWLRWLDDGSLAIALLDAEASYSLYRARVGGQMVRLGSIPRALSTINVSADMKRAVVVTRDYHGDAWMSKVTR